MNIKEIKYNIKLNKLVQEFLSLNINNYTIIKDKTLLKELINIVITYNNISINNLRITLDSFFDPKIIVINHNTYISLDYNKTIRLYITDDKAFLIQNNTIILKKQHIYTNNTKDLINKLKLLLYS